jgi:hypothetical protein
MIRWTGLVMGPLLICRPPLAGEAFLIDRSIRPMLATR